MRSASALSTVAILDLALSRKARWGRLELPEIGAHGLEKPLLLRTVAAGAWLVNNLEPGSSKHLLVEHLSLDGRPGARRPWEVDEQVVAHPQVPA